MKLEAMLPSYSALRRRQSVRKRSQNVDEGYLDRNLSESSNNGPRTKKRAGFYDSHEYPSLQIVDFWVLACITLLALVTRFYRLSVPAAVVFDEVHFLKFIQAILRREYIFDIHPPLGKQVLAYIGYLLGFRPTDFFPDKIGKLYPPELHYYRLRAISAFFGTLTVPMTYLVCHMLDFSRVASTFGAMMVLFDTLNVIESRLILMDSQLIFWCQVALFCALNLWRTKPGSEGRFRWLTLTGLAAGTALSIKHTALATPALIATVSFFGVHFLEQPLSALECSYAGLVGMLVYVLSFYVHFRTLIYSGGKGDKFMKQDFQRTLINHPKYDPLAVRPSFFKLFFYLNRRMVSSSANIKKRHNWESDWYQWIVNWRGVLYFTQKDKIDDKDRTLEKSIIYLLGNPFIIYLCLTTIASFIVGLLFFYRYRQVLSSKLAKPGMQSLYTGIFLLAGWACNLIPYILVDRPAFLYHYIPGLFYAQLLTALVIDMLPPKPKVAVALGLTVLILAAFLYWGPWTYVYSLTIPQHRARRWLPRWT